MLPALTLAFTFGLSLGSFVPYFPLSVTFFLLAVAVGAAILEARSRVAGSQLTAGFCCVLSGIVYWVVAVEGTARAPFFENERELHEVLTGRIIAPVQQAPDQLVLVVRCDQTSAGSNQPRVVRLTWRVPERLLYQGDRIRVRAKLRAPGGSLNPGGFDYATYLERQGIDATATVTDVDAVELLESGRENVWWMPWNQFDQWRGAIRRAAVRNLSQPALGLYLGIIIGERGYLDQDLRDQFMVAGTVHLLSISGSHLGLVAILTFVAVKRAMRFLPSAWLLALSRRITPSRIAAVVTVFPVTAYTCLAGAELATVRSLVMVLVALITKWLGYEHRMFHALAVAAVAILLHNPLGIYDISFQLSFLSVCAIAWWLTRPGVAEEEKPLGMGCFSTGVRWGWNAIGMSMVVTLATVPLVAFYFNQLPWLGLFTNVVAVPVMGVLLVPIGLLAALWQYAVGSDNLPMAGLLQWSLDRFVDGLTYVSLIPGGEWHVSAPAFITMLMFYGCLAMIWFRVGAGWIQWMSGVALSLILLWWIWSPRLQPDGDRFRVMFLDVSQGDSAVLELPDGQVVLIDGGATYERFDMGRGVVAPYLWNRGIRSIDHVIATHPQLDHVGGLAWVLRHFTVRQFWATGDRREEPFYQNLQQALAYRGLTEQVARQGQEMLSSDSCQLKVLNPPDRPDVGGLPVGRRMQGHALNNRSIVTELICGVHRILFTADVEQETLLRMSQDSHEHERVALVKVPHHGASSSLQMDWLSAVRPRYAVISVGRHNPYGHPAPAVLNAYVAQGASLFRTDRDGGILVAGRRSDAVLQIHRTRDQKVDPVAISTCFWACEKANFKKLFARFED